MARGHVKSAPTPETVKDYVNLPYRLEIIPDGGVFVVRYPELPGCITQVERWEEALPAAREILEGWLELAIEDGQTIPVPRQREQFSGRFVLRISKSLHRQLAEAAEQEGVSLNAYATTLLAGRHCERETMRRLDEICDRIDSNERIAL